MAIEIQRPIFESKFIHFPTFNMLESNHWSSRQNKKSLISYNLNHLSIFILIFLIDTSFNGN
jgi:hypothetical protein